MAIDTALCTQALSHLNVSKVVTQATIADTPEGVAIEAFYEQARQQVLRERPWSFAVSFADLALATEEPTTEWGYAFHTPADHLFVRRIVIADRVRNTRVRPAYRLVRDFVSTAWNSATDYLAGQYALVNGVWYRAVAASTNVQPVGSPSIWEAMATGFAPPKLLLTDQQEVTLEYTVDVTDLAQWDRHAYAAFACLLAALVAPRVTGGDEFKLGKRALDLYQWHLNRAVALDANEDQPDEPMISDFERAR